MLNLVNNKLIEQLIEHQSIVLRVKDFIRDNFVTSTPSALSQELRRTVPLSIFITSTERDFTIQVQFWFVHFSFVSRL